MADQFQLVSNDGDEWYERRVMVSGQLISIQLRPEAKAFHASLPYAEDVINNIEYIISALYDFVAVEKRKFPVYQDDFDQLKVSAIDFVSKDEPGVAEITFDETPDGRIWGCVCENNHFYNLGFDD